MARSLAYRAAAAAARDPLANLNLSSMAKVGATEVGGRVVDRAVQVMGRFGLVRGSVIERLYREARPMRIYEGSTEVILDSLAKQLVKHLPGATVIIDAHCHVWPDHIAATVLAGRPADLDARHDGTIAGLRRTMDEAGIDRAICLGVAHAARTVQRTNEFIGSVDRTRFIPFGTVHPELSPAANLKSLQDNGIRGVKLHPLFQDLSLADPRVVDIAAALAQAGITVIAHVGAGGDADANDRGSPRSLRALLDAVPGLRVIACHFGGYHRLDEAEELLVGSRAVLETSWPPSTAGLDPGPYPPDHRPARRRPRRLRIRLADDRPGRGNRRHPRARPATRGRGRHPWRQPGRPAGHLLRNRPSVHPGQDQNLLGSLGKSAGSPAASGMCWLFQGSDEGQCSVEGHDVAGEEARFIGREVHDQPLQVARLPHPTEGDVGDETLVFLRSLFDVCCHARVHGPWAYGVGAKTPAGPCVTAKDFVTATIPPLEAA